MHQMMDWNDDVSDEVKAGLAMRKICMVNVMGSPGAGKTSLITSIAEKLSKKWRIPLQRLQSVRP